MQDHEPSSVNRITELVSAKKEGREITCYTRFEINPVDFTHLDNPFQAHVFFCYFHGDMDAAPYEFRKCYAKGCPHNLCPHVSQAVMIANRYLARDFRRLQDAGIHVEENFFSLDDMVVKFEQIHETGEPAVAIEDFIQKAKSGEKVGLDITLTYMPAVEHFLNQKNSQVFLMGDFVRKDQMAGSSVSAENMCRRCFSCYPEKEENNQKEEKIKVANQRLAGLYQDFDDAGISYEKKFFG